MVSLQAAETAAAVAPAAAPDAAAQLVVADVSWWQTLWAQIQAPLIALAMAVVSALGVVITTQVKSFLGERAAQAVNAVYQQMADAGAGWLIAQLHSVAEPVVVSVPSSSPVGSASAVPTGKVIVSKPAAREAVNAAVDYAKKSYPEVVKKLGTGDAELGKDILAAAGKILGGTPAGGIISIVGGLLGQMPNH
jgi:hypothetical protein